MLELVADVIYKVTGKKGVTYDTDFVKDLALSSFDIMNIIGMFEEHFDEDIPTKDVWKLHNVQDVIDYLAEKGHTNP